MSQSSTEEPPDLNTWTKEVVHHWLMNVVKVPQKKLKEGSQHESQFPAEVENWTKEEVAQWLVGHVKVDGKKAERFQEEEVSGDCLVCFEEQDFLDLGLKKGPTLKILKGLRRLRIQESTPPSRIKSFFKGKNKQAGKNLPMERKTTEVTFQNPAPLIKNTLDGLSAYDFSHFKFHLNNYGTAPGAAQAGASNLGFGVRAAAGASALNVERATTMDSPSGSTFLPGSPKWSHVVKKGRRHASEKAADKPRLRTVAPERKNKSDPECTAIPLCRLEGKDTSDIATVVTNHYGPDKALRITQHVLRDIHQRDLADQLQSHMGTGPGIG
ncbi:hypothetical protein JOQ06_028454 [Pogonophryne albipinna]|uniref:SAM domain-containing protein n=1 Tax=Pogonophryne albipinna TaxID=1090488 RepID=A0AAD6B6J2_9TELE|nr:hypothetical protein JOQ06_028454 [Pogonophryne albipinna]